MWWLENTNLYISSLYIWTQEELDELDKIQKDYEPENPSFHELMEIFPEAKTFVAKKLKSEIEDCKKSLSLALETERELTNIINRLSKPEDKWFWHMVAQIWYIMPLREGKENQIKRNVFYLSSLKNQVPQKGKITEHDILLAKQVPLSNFIKYDHAGFCLCPLHKDSNKSFKVYEKQNTWYCFSENIGGDIIEYCMRSQDLKFLEAVKFLLNKK